MLRAGACGGERSCRPHQPGDGYNPHRLWHYSAQCFPRAVPAKLGSSPGQAFPPARAEFAGLQSGCIQRTEPSFVPPAVVGRHYGAINLRTDHQHGQSTAPDATQRAVLLLNLIWDCKRRCFPGGCEAARFFVGGGTGAASVGLSASFSLSCYLHFAVYATSVSLPVLGSTTIAWPTIVLKALMPRASVRRALGTLKVLNTPLEKMKAARVSGPVHTKPTISPVLLMSLSVVPPNPTSLGKSSV